MKKYFPFLIAIACFFSLPVFAQFESSQSPNPVAQKWPFNVKTIEPVSEKIRLPVITIKKPAVVTINPEDINGFERLQCTPVYKNKPTVSLNAERTTPQKVHLQWETKYLVDNAGFNVEQSFDDTAHFKVVDFVSGHLNAKIKEKYKLQDNNAYMNVTYYRLKQFRMDNSYVYSNIVSVDGVRPFKLFPNPVVNQLNLQVAAMQPGTATITIYDALGRPLNTKMIMLFKNVLNSQSINVANLKAGIYCTKVFMADKNVRSGIFIKR